MRHYLVASLSSGIVYAVLGPVFVHVLLDEGLRNELMAVFARVTGEAPAGGTEPAAGWGEYALHIALRLLFGAVTVAVFAVLQRKRSRWRAARIAGLSFWVLAYCIWPIVLAVKFGMGTTLLFVAMGYGLVETQLAAFVGAIAWGRKAQPKA